LAASPVGDVMSDAGIAGTGFAALLLLIALRMPVGLAMLVCGAVGYVSINGAAPFLAYIKSTPYYLFSNYTLSVIPLFVLMGAVALRSGLAERLFAAASTIFGHRRGGMAMATIGACTAFGAICGSSVATTAAMGRVALPELKRYGYADRLATGTVAVGGTLGILIPPSVILVIYAISAEQNIVKLFKAALLPGLLAAFFYMLAIAWIVRRDPAAGPALPQASRSERWAALRRTWPVILIAIAVVGGIYGGVFTPTEGASVGAIMTVLLGLADRKLDWAGLRISLLQTAETTAMILIILLGAEVFNTFLALAQMPTYVATMIARLGLPPYAILVALLLIYIVLGGVMDEIAMILLTLPVFFPIVAALDFGLNPEETAIWFGILVLIIVGIGLVAPPIGLNVFVVGSLAGGVPLTTVYRGVLPFIATDIVRLALVVAFPGLALALVRWLN
jgi:C4-dicarboxylate transporter, DctM subunit